LVIAYEKIPKSTQTTELTTTQKIDQIVQTIDQYRQEIEHLQGTNHTYHSPRGEGAEEEGSNNADRGYGVTSQHSGRLVRERTQLWMKLEEDQ
jgi:hypothetical protein